MFARVVAAVVTLALGAILLILAWPQLFRLERTFIVAQAVSLRGSAAAIAVLAALGFTVLALLSPRARRFAAGLAIVLVAFAGLQAAVLATRGFAAPSTGTAADDDLVVLSWNTLGDEPGADEIARLALEVEADVVALPETSQEAATAIARAMGERGRPMWAHSIAFDQISKARTTSLLISAELGDYVLDESAGTTGQLPSVVAVPVDGNGPTIAALHPVAPVPKYMDRWRSDLEWAAALCERENVIVAGDFNATLDHMSSLRGDGELGDCHDAALVSGSAAMGTWPAFLPPLLGAPIDHVMATRQWHVAQMRVIESRDGFGSDHRPIVALLSPAG